MTNITLTNQCSQEIFNETQKFSSELSRPQQFNFREIIRGILMSGSTYLADIGKTNGTGKNERKTVEKLSRTLGKLPMEKFAAIHARSQASRYQNEAVLILSDGGDFQKPYARKMGNICHAADGSNGHKVGNGYLLHSLVALGVKSEDIRPLALSVYSTRDEGFRGEWDEQRKNFELLHPFIKSSSFDRIIVEDRGCDDEKRFMYFLNELEASFVTRIHAGAKSRKLMIQREDGEFERMKVSELSQKLRPKAGGERRWWNQKIKKELASKIAFQRVFLPEHTDTPLYAVFCYSEGYEEPLVVLTDLKTDDFEKAWKHFFYYKKRWEVENFYRAIKQQFGAEKFLILDFEKIRALTFSVMLAYTLLLKIKQKLIEFLGFMHEMFKAFCHREQRSGEHHLDVLAFLRAYFANPDPFYSYRFYSGRFRKNLCRSTKNQLQIFNPRKIW